MALSDEQRSILEQTSRTFYVPIMGLPGPLQETVASAYLCFRAIDEIEDHPELPPAEKIRLLDAVSACMQCGPGWTPGAWDQVFQGVENILPEVSCRLGEWAGMSPPAFAPRIWDATAAMAGRMATWAACNWRIDGREDLDHYTFSVAGAVGLLLSDIWAWQEGIQTDRSCAIGYGRGLQLVNILRNREEDLARGVDFFPNGWDVQQVRRYCRDQLILGAAYNQALPPGPVRRFCQIPLALAEGTLAVFESGRDRLSRDEVRQIVHAIDAAS